MTSATRPGAERRVSPTAQRFLGAARHHLREAGRGSDARVRYLEAHLAALRAAAAVLEQRRVEAGRPAPRRPRNVWEQSAEDAPDLGPWIGVFAASAQRRAAVEAGVLLPERAEVERLVADALEFLEVARAAVARGAPAR